MLIKSKPVFLLVGLLIIQAVTGGRIARDDHEDETKPKRKIVITMKPPEIPKKVVTPSPEENFFSVTKALVKTITEMDWPVIKQEEDDDNIFGYRVSNLKIDPFYVRSAEFDDNLSIRINGAFGQARANFYVSKEIDIWFYKQTLDLQGSMLVDFSDVTLIADLKVVDDLQIDLKGCKSDVGKVDVDVNVTSDSWWQQLIGTVINTLSWLFSGWVTDIMNDELCPGFETVLEEYPETFAKLAQSVIENAGAE